MIPILEIKAVARKERIPESTVERDYAQNWLLFGLSKTSLKMALKGGTGIRKAYIEDYRFSDDLDFTLLEEYDRETIRRELLEGVRIARKESGISFKEEVDFKETPNGYEARVYFRIIRASGAPLKIKIDLTKKENEPILLPLEKRKIIHPYSDECNAEIFTYSLEEIFAEKVRSLFQRTRPRDLYDVWRLKDIIELETALNILPEKFRLKNVQLDMKTFEGRRIYYERAWERSLAHQISPLPEFDRVWNDVLKFLSGRVLSYED
ncbi:nucleotidyl transferase AbiEii/AbiGii toxin family protein [Pyrococcus kukulkanii]|uniref:nucleotidyl transferase AbiEii/AbiGii toxin family protein n=1 Tax=Pyrococcus kukulkanii TaxID=1609559 RepID=UPI00356462FB